MGYYAFEIKPGNFPYDLFDIHVIDKTDFIRSLYLYFITLVLIYN
jgi:hypothetical protein